MHTSSSAPTRRQARRQIASRDVVVTAREYVTDHMLRITFAGEDLHAVVHGTAGSWVKLFITTPAGEEHGRAYTVRGFNPFTNEIEIDFFIHQGGRMPQWAASCQLGERARVGGPRRGGAPAGDIAALTLFGDETSLPAIQAIAERAHDGQAVSAFIELGDDADRQHTTRRGNVAITWLSRDAGTPPGSELLRVAATQQFASDSAVWFAAEARAAQLFRQILADHSPATAHVQGYWRSGVGDYRE